MEQLDLIRMTHEIDKSLARIAGAVSDESIKRRLATFQTEWRDLTYAVTAHLCGVSADGTPTPVRRRGRPRKTSLDHQMSEDGQVSSERES